MGPKYVGGGSCTVTTSPTTILVTGGDQNGKRKKVAELNISSGNWRYLPEMGEVRAGHGCTIVGRKVVVAGGWYKSSEILDLDTEQWSRAGDLETVRRWPQLVTVNGRVIILGGQVGKTLDTVE